MEQWTEVLLVTIETYDFLLSLSSTSIRLFDMFKDENTDLTYFKIEQVDTRYDCKLLQTLLFEEECSVLAF